MILQKYLDRIETGLKKSLEEMGEKSALRDACAYSLDLGGKRLRPLIVLMTAESLGQGFDCIDVALSVEYFHTASLIADDLPCMDNDDMRRNRPSLHKAFGEDIALLASYTLIAAGYGGIHQNAKRMGNHPHIPQAVLLSLEAATRCAGLQGATLGQFYDLYPPNGSWEMLKRIIYLKTVTLFEISFFFGWLFGGGDPKKLPALKECAYHLGLSFQISDDLQDNETENREFALKNFEKSMGKLKGALSEVGLWTAPFQELFTQLLSRGNLFASDFFQRLAP